VAALGDFVQNHLVAANAILNRLDQFDPIDRTIPDLPSLVDKASIPLFLRCLVNLSAKKEEDYGPNLSWREFTQLNTSSRKRAQNPSESDNEYSDYQQLPIQDICELKSRERLKKIAYIYLKTKAPFCPLLETPEQYAYHTTEDRANMMGPHGPDASMRFLQQPGGERGIFHAEHGSPPIGTGREDFTRMNIDDWTLYTTEAQQIEFLRSLGASIFLASQLPLSDRIEGSLINAAYHGNAEMVRELLDDPRINVVDAYAFNNPDYQMCPLVFSALFGCKRRGNSVEVLRILVTDPRIDLNEVAQIRRRAPGDPGSWVTALSAALINQNNEAVRVLLDAGAYVGMSELKNISLHSKKLLLTLVKSYVYHNKKSLAVESILYLCALGLPLFLYRTSECLGDLREEETSSICATTYGSPAQKTFEECFWQGP